MTAAGATWHMVARLSDLEEGDMLPFKAEGKSLIIYIAANGVFATDRRCTHQAADLLRGYFEGEIIECPVHQGRFNIKSGKALSPPVCEALKTYDIKIIDDQIHVNLGG